jgi:hypothetical protein
MCPNGQEISARGQLIAPAVEGVGQPAVREPCPRPWQMCLDGTRLASAGLAASVGKGAPARTGRSDGGRS